MKDWAWFFSFLPRTLLQYALYWQWCRSLTRGERIRLSYYGATGNPSHHEFQWADALPSAQGIEARQRHDPEEGRGPKDESPVAESDAPKFPSNIT